LKILITLLGDYTFTSNRACALATFETYVVIGPDKKGVMNRLIKETDPRAEVLTLNDAESLEGIVEQINSI
jgi:hypothetical protein